MQYNSSEQSVIVYDTKIYLATLRPAMLTVALFDQQSLIKIEVSGGAVIRCTGADRQNCHYAAIVCI